VRTITSAQPKPRTVVVRVGSLEHCVWVVDVDLWGIYVLGSEAKRIQAEILSWLLDSYSVKHRMLMCTSLNPYVDEEYYDDGFRERCCGIDDKVRCAAEYACEQGADALVVLRAGPGYAVAMVWRRD